MFMSWPKNMEESNGFSLSPDYSSQWQKALQFASSLSLAEKVYEARFCGLADRFLFSVSDK
ncbi:hypothetical protein I7I50_11574 [Histoplasma capsulatum G186AR]|uniref:Uncharacterized protein n=1 Tax=Ajellomyces capsulatus TaxID=5037 RepID=A0A8H8D9D5_AJECA|nr:hypothetical protein I7I52_02811 [Histoplasma capsulatum]QSS70071.1 hypothetical protein I7I50_11574 [Histoplasma capsulatum G186AR]